MQVNRGFKKTFDNPTQKRVKNLVSISKSQTEQVYREKRRPIPKPHEVSDVNVTSDDEQNAIIENFLQFFSRSDVIEPIQQNSQPPLEDIAHHVLGLRKILSRSESPPIRRIIQTDVPNIVLFLMRHYQNLTVHILHEVLWILSNIASGPTSIVTQLFQALPELEELAYGFMNPDAAPSLIVAQAMWFVSNRLGDGSDIIERYIEQHKIVDSLCYIMQRENNDVETRKMVAYAMSNIALHKDYVSSPKTRVAVEPLLDLAANLFCLHGAEHEDIVADSLRTMSIFLETQNDDLLKATLPKIPLQDIVKYTKAWTDSSASHIPLCMNIVFKIMGSICSIPEPEYTQTIIDSGFLDACEPFFRHIQSGAVMHDEHLKTMMWALSNITAGTSQQSSAVLRDRSYVFDTIVHCATKRQRKAHMEALYCLAMCIEPQTASTIEALYYEKGVLILLCEGIIKFANDIGIFECLTKSVLIMLAMSGNQSKLKPLLESSGALHPIEDFADTSRQESVVNTCWAILDHFKDAEEEYIQPFDMDTENFSAQRQDQQPFSF